MATHIFYSEIVFLKYGFIFIYFSTIIYGFNLKIKLIIKKYVKGMLE